MKWKINKAKDNIWYLKRGMDRIICESSYNHWIINGFINDKDVNMELGIDSLCLDRLVNNLNKLK